MRSRLRTLLIVYALELWVLFAFAFMGVCSSLVSLTARWLNFYYG